MSWLALPGTCDRYARLTGAVLEPELLAEAYGLGQVGHADADVVDGLNRWLDHEIGL